MTSEKKPIGEIAMKLSTDKQYTDRLLNDYTFAKREFLKAGLKIDTVTHKRMSAGYKSLTEAAKKLFKAERVGIIVIW